MFNKFQYKKVPLANISLDLRNPRIVSQEPLKSQEEIISYLFEYEDLSKFIKKIAAEGLNIGAERPYIVAEGDAYVVLEGNSRIATYKLLTGQIKPPEAYASDVPQISEDARKFLEEIDCSIAPNRDALLPIMANAHFGNGDKSKWGYLGSRKAVFEEWKLGKTIPALSKVFGIQKSQIVDLLIEFTLYNETLKLGWTKEEMSILLNPAVAFNPPVRFLQTSGHKEQIGISYDRVHIAVSFKNEEAKAKYKHLVQKLVISPTTGLGATASYADVFEDFKYKETGIPANSISAIETPAAPDEDTGISHTSPTTSEKDAGGSSPSATPASSPHAPKLKKGALFNYKPKKHSLLIQSLMKEAKDLNCEKFPASGTFLMRNLLETILKHIIDEQTPPATSTATDLEGAINRCLSKDITLSKADKDILKEFKNHHLTYLNLGAHGTTNPNYTRLISVRDCVDPFVRRNA
jgi:hypothetical protein